MSGAAMQIRRTCLVLTCLGLASALCVTGQNLLLRSSDNQVRLSAPSFHFINGKALERLKNGLTVPFDIHVSVYGDNSKSVILWKDFERFTLSYDLWEERFSVTRLRSQRSSASHLTAQQAEAWCLDRFAIPQQGLPTDRAIHFRVDVFAREPRSETAQADEPLSLGTLIDLLSRPARTQHLAHSRVESGPVRIAEITKAQALP
jgi:hypothetical protein